MKTKPKDHFALDILASVLSAPPSGQEAVKGFRPLKGPFDPKGNWKLSYNVCTMYGTPWPVGDLTLERKALPDGSSVLKMNYVKSIPQNKLEPLYSPDYILQETEQNYQKLTAEIHCKDDELSTPISWTFNFESQDETRNPIKITRLRKSAVVKNGKVEITDGKYRQVINAPSAHTVHWALFDAVQRLPRKDFKPLHFTMFDRFDQIKPNQTLSYRKTVDLIVGGNPTQELRLHGYDHLGEGIIPWIYWVDDKGRLLFVVSGIEGYISKGMRWG